MTLTKREEYVKAAMQGILAGAPDIQNSGAQMIARRAVAYADAAISEAELIDPAWEDVCDECAAPLPGRRMNGKGINVRICARCAKTHRVAVVEIEVAYYMLRLVGTNTFLKDGYSGAELSDFVSGSDDTSCAMKFDTREAADGVMDQLRHRAPCRLTVEEIVK